MTLCHQNVHVDVVLLYVVPVIFLFSQSAALCANKNLPTSEQYHIDQIVITCDNIKNKSLP